jgi:hypothetical protein
MPNWLTFGISIVGLFLSGIYFRYMPCGEDKKDTDLVEKIFKTLKKAKKEFLLKDYEITIKEVERRENITLVVGSILIAASFLIVSQPIFITNKDLVPFAAVASIGLYGFWLFLIHLTTKLLDDKAYSRIRAIEQKLKVLGWYHFGIHSFLRGKEPENWWLQFRRRFWGFTYMFLCLYWMFFSFLIVP